MSKIHLFIVDPQKDFINPKGSLYVKGADECMSTLANWITENSDIIGDITVSLDCHPSVHIGDPGYWEDSAGVPASPGMVITKEDLIEGTWVPRLQTEKNELLVEMISMFPSEGIHLWPEHCKEHSWGASIPKYLKDALEKWAYRKSFEKGSTWNVNYIEKGTHSWDEAYSAFSEVIYGTEFVEGNIESFKANQGAEGCDYVVLAGQAKDYCVARTVYDLLKMPEVAEKLIFLTDMMPVIDPDNPSLSIYKTAEFYYKAKSMYLQDLREFLGE